MITLTIISTLYKRMEISSSSCHSGSHKGSISSDSSALNLYNCPLHTTPEKSQTATMERITAFCDSGSLPMHTMARYRSAAMTVRVHMDVQIDTTKKNGISLQTMFLIFPISNSLHKENMGSKKPKLS